MYTRGFATALLLLAAVPALAADYYVSPSGNDKQAGTASQPWKSIAQVNKNHYQAGDRILFRGGATFSGTLQFGNTSSGTAANPIQLTSYGTGRATISAGTGAGLYVYNTAGFAISNLNFAGSGASKNAQAGISFYADQAGPVKFDTIRIDSADIGGFGEGGIVIGSWAGMTGYTNVSITNTTVHDNGTAGIEMYAETSMSSVGYPHANIYVGHCQAYNNAGLAGTSGSSGSGIVIGSANGVVIERSLAYNNGANNTANGGPVGIWAYDSNNVTIQYNESHHNHTNSVTDGDGFDLDGGVTSSVMQYNYSHDNDGAGYLLAQYSGARPHNNNTIRYNISQNDGRKNGIGAIDLWNGGSGIQSETIYNNTVFVAPAPASTRAILFQSATTGVNVWNNILVTTGGVPVIDVAPGQSGLEFQGNDYWSSGAALTLRWNGGSYASLAAWRSGTGQEILSGGAVGFNLDPRLTAPGTGGSIDNPDALSTLTAYRLLSTSPMIGKGLSLPALFGINVGTVDYYGNTIPSGTGYNVGAN